MYVCMVSCYACMVKNGCMQLRLYVLYMYVCKESAAFVTHYTFSHIHTLICGIVSGIIRVFFLQKPLFYALFSTIERKMDSTLIMT